MSRPLAAALVPPWALASRLALAHYMRQLEAGPAVNAATLRGILRRSAVTRFGRAHRFAALAGADDVEAAFRSALPLVDHTASQADFADIAAGQCDVRFPGRPRLFVSSSGTTGDPKRFPVTARQQREALRFMALLTPAARARAVPGLGFTPRTAMLLVASRADRQTSGGIPLGNPSGAGLRRILAVAPPFWVFPPAVLTVTDPRSALYLHALFALRAADLACIEAIYCSHVVGWMALIGRSAEALLRDVADGGVAADLDLAPAQRAMLARHAPPDPARARALAVALAGPDDGCMTRLWPALRVVSSVTSGAFALGVPRLRALAGPGPAFYPTCFGATEGMVGINLPGDSPEHYALALGAAHFELLPVTAAGVAVSQAIGLADAQPGQRYEIVLTNHAGLYRYRLGDVVRVVRRAGTTPVFAFDHRRGNVVDLVGEKTTEQHFTAALAGLAATLPGGTATLAAFSVWPDIDRVPYRYVVYAELSPSAPLPDTAATTLDGLLARENPAYATLARANGRLAALELRRVAPGTFDRLLALRREAADGANANQVKVPCLLRDAGQRRLLDDGWIDAPC